MRFLRVSLTALMIFAMVTGSALAAEGESSTVPVTDPAPAPEPAPVTDTAVVDAVYGDPSVTDAVYDAKLGGVVVSITPPEGDQPGSIVLNVAGKEITLSYTAEMLEGEVAAGTYIEVKGTTQELEKIAVVESEEEARGTEVKTAVVGITPAEDPSLTTITLMIGGQAVEFTAEELGIPAEAIELIGVGSEFKLSTNEEGKTEMKISGDGGSIKVETKEDGTFEVKVDAGKPGKGEETSAEKKAAAEEHKAEAKEHKAEAQLKKAEAKEQKKAEAKEQKKAEVKEQKAEKKSGKK